MIRVLYVHHAGAFGGASRSLLELIGGFAGGAVTARLVTQRGDVARIFAEHGIEIVTTPGISQFDHTRFGHYRGRRWLLLARELFYLPFTALALLRARARWPDVDLVHVNEIVSLAAIVLARRLFRRPVIVHVRSVQHARHDSLRSRLVASVLRRHAAAVVAIDETVRASLPPGIAAEVVHNGYAPRPGAAGAAPPLPPKTPGVLRVAMVGNALAFKGVREFVEAARLARERGLAAEFFLVGLRPSGGGPLRRLLKAAGFVHDAADEVRSEIARHGLGQTVRLFDFTADIDRVYRDIDVLCFPSHLDAAGRPVFEAAHWKVPSIVAVREPRADTFVDRETGLRVEAGDPAAIADAVEHFCRHPAEVARMGEAARRLALENFDSRRNAQRMLGIYRRALDAARPPEARA